MSLDVSALQAYIEEQEIPLVAKMQATGGLAEVVNKQLGVKGTVNLQFLDTTVTFGAHTCSRTPADSTTLTSRPLVSGGIKISENICAKDLHNTYLQTMLSQGVDGSLEIPFEQLWLEKKTNRIQHALAKSDFQGDTTSGNANLNRYDGLLKIIDNSAGVIAGNTTGAVSITASNVLEVLDAMWEAVPENIADKDNLSLWMPYSVYRMYKLALKNANLFHYTGAEGESEKLYGTNVTIRKTTGLNGVTRMILSADDNITIGMDGSEDDKDFKVRLDPETEELVFFDVAFRRAVQVAFPDEIVEFTLSA